MKIAVIADAHANLSALKAALEAIRLEDCDFIFHMGDAIAIGPLYIPLQAHLFLRILRRPSPKPFPYSQFFPDTMGLSGWFMGSRR
jgi:hypothetical protein